MRCYCERCCGSQSRAPHAFAKLELPKYSFPAFVVSNTTQRFVPHLTDSFSLSPYYRGVMQKQEVGVIRFPLPLRVAAEMVRLADAASVQDVGNRIAHFLTALRMGTGGAAGAPPGLFLKSLVANQPRQFSQKHHSPWGVKKISEKVGQTSVPPSSPPQSYRRRTVFAVIPTVGVATFSAFI